MEERLKYSLLRDATDNQNIWSRQEKRLWFCTLILGTTSLYSTRTTMPLLVPAVAAERKWNKTDSGTILSSFFWGYTLTQVLGGYFSDRIGGQRVMLAAAIGWSLITFWMPNFILMAPKSLSWGIPFIVVVRIINGACQGVHFPSMISITSQNLCANERASFFSMLTCGSAFGTLLTGTVGSIILDYFGWPAVFRVIGFLGLVWTLCLRYYTMSWDKNRVVNVQCPKLVHHEASVPWLRFLRCSSLWACVIAHACEMNCFFVLLSWLPTYFHDTFPTAKGWVVNMIPWLALPPCTILGKILTDWLVARKWSLTAVRKIVQSVCFLSQNIALAFLCHATDFSTALACMTIIIGGSGFHNNGVTVNPQDLSPTYSGSVFGLMNTMGAVPGFLGVYLAGYILELTQSWTVVFSTSIAFNLFGWIVFTLFGSADVIQ
uniref:Putative solute carrier family 17 member 9-like protein n=1 Tax=Lutzomyia longipalpis TaxID=7200 RepID=A0A1B0GKF9_LUTLO